MRPPAGAAASVRPAGKVILLDGDGRTLLFRGGDPARPGAGTWWFPPGGGVEGDETIEECARRELREETGLDVDDLGPVVHERRVVFEFDGGWIDARESYFLVRVATSAVLTDGWTAQERQVVAEYRWWSLDELRATDETVFPEALIEILEG